MIRSKYLLNIAVATVALFTWGATAVHAQKIVCWKDASGKVVGCGDKVPPEFAGGGTKELDKHGNVRKTGESAEQAAARRAKEKELAIVKEEEAKRLKEQKRQDQALLNTFSNEKEIDLKRDRELQALNNFLTQQAGAQKAADARLADARKRAETFEKDKKPLPPVVKEDLARAEREKSRIDTDIANNEKAKADTTAKYAEYRKRFMELRGLTPAAEAPAPPATPSAPATPVAAKK